MEFRVGDLVEILDVDAIDLGEEIKIIDGKAEVIDVHYDENGVGVLPRLLCVSGDPLIIDASELQYIKKLEY